MNRPTPAQDRIRAALPEINAMIEAGKRHKHIREHLGVSNTAWDRAVKAGIIARSKAKTMPCRLRRLRILMGRINIDGISDEALAAIADYAHRNGIDNLAEAIMEIALDELAEGRLGFTA